MRALNTQAYRTLFPFLMIIVVVLLLVWRLVGSFAHTETPPEVSFCTGETHAYRVVKGDTCWDLSQSNGFTLKQLRDSNPGLNCDSLMPGETICLPPRSSKRR